MIEALILKTIVLAVVTMPVLASVALENGVSRAECEMRLEVWNNEMNFTATMESLDLQGQSASVRLECEPK